MIKIIVTVVVFSFLVSSAQFASAQSVYLRTELEGNLSMSDEVLHQLLSTITSCEDKTNSENLSQIKFCDKTLLSFGNHMRNIFIPYQLTINSILYPEEISFPFKDFNPNNAVENFNGMRIDAQDLKPVAEKVSKLLEACIKILHNPDSNLLSTCLNLVKTFGKELELFKNENNDNVVFVQAASSFDASRPDSLVSKYRNKDFSTTTALTSQDNIKQQGPIRNFSIYRNTDLGIQLEYPKSWGSAYVAQREVCYPSCKASFDLSRETISQNSVYITNYYLNASSIENSCRCSNLKEFVKWEYSLNGPGEIKVPVFGDFDNNPNNSFDYYYPKVIDNLTSIWGNHPAWQMEYSYDKYGGAGYKLWFLRNDNVGYVIHYRSDHSFSKYIGQVKQMIESIQFIGLKGPPPPPQEPSFMK